MEQNQINHQLNGYKYSFNRVNPYLLETSSQLTNNGHKKQELLIINTKQSPNKPIHQATVIKPKPSKQKNKQSSNIMPQPSMGLKNTKQMFYKRPQSDKNKVLMDLYLRKTRFNNLKGLQGNGESKVQNSNKHLNVNNKRINNSLSQITSRNKSHLSNSNISSSMIDSSILTETKELEYDENQEQDNYYDDEKGEERLEQLVLQKNDTQRIGNIPIIVTSKSNQPFKIEQEQSVRQQQNVTSQQQFTDNHITLLPKPKHNIQSTNNNKKRQQSLHINTTNNNSIQNSKKKSKPTANNNYKILRNLSEHKFSPYLASSPRSKVNKQGTAPIVVEVSKNEKTKSLLKLYPSTSDINPMMTIEASSSGKKKIKHESLKIKTQNCEQLHKEQLQKNDYNLHINLISLNSPQTTSNLLTPNHNTTTSKKQQLQPLKLQNLKIANQQLSGRKHLGLMGQIKYRSPRMILSSRNQLFKGVNKKEERQKIKLFTDEEEGKIIREFYSQEKGEGQ